MNLPLSLFLDLVRMSRQRVKALVAGRRARRAVQPALQLQQQQQLLQMPLLLYDEYDDQVRVANCAEVWYHGNRAGLCTTREGKFRLTNYHLSKG